MPAAMVKKFIFNLTDSVEVAKRRSTTLAPRDALQENNKLFSELARIKNEITHYHRRERKWERYKKLANDYELIHSSSGHCFPSIASAKPISRSFFKLHEILVDLRDEIRLPSSTAKAAFLADAPGGFVQAFVEYRRASGSDEVHAISLAPRNSYVPAWKLSPGYCAEHNINICCDETTSGDLTDSRVVDDFVRCVTPGTCDLVTADGGFDFSADFNDQESRATELIAAEAVAALQLQKPGGAFVLKIYDIGCETTITILYILFTLYKSVYLHKPLTSRPANSEKYVVCTGYLGPTANAHAGTISLLWSLSRGSRARRHHATASPPQPSVPSVFVESLFEFNSVYVAQQAFAIARTIAFIDKAVQQKDASIIHTQLRKAIRWCHKYKIPIDLRALGAYRQHLLNNQIPSEDPAQPRPPRS